MATKDHRQRGAGDDSQEKRLDFYQEMLPTADKISLSRISILYWKSWGFLQISFARFRMLAADLLLVGDMKIRELPVSILFLEAAMP